MTQWQFFRRLLKIYVNWWTTVSRWSCIIVIRALLLLCLYVSLNFRAFFNFIFPGRKRKLITVCFVQKTLKKTSPRTAMVGVNTDGYPHNNVSNFIYYKPFNRLLSLQNSQVAQETTLYTSHLNLLTLTNPLPPAGHGGDIHLLWVGKPVKFPDTRVKSLPFGIQLYKPKSPV